MNREASRETANGVEYAQKYLQERVSAVEKQVETAGISLRETAKWITSGTAVATAGVIAGTSLSSLGALGVGWRLLAALAASAIGFLGLISLVSG